MTLSEDKGLEYCEAGVEDGEICLFPNIDYLHESVGSTMERQLTQYKDGHCRFCGGLITIKERFCSDKCKKEYDDLFELRLKVGKHDLRRRGFD